MPIPYYASEVNGITDDMVADSSTFDKVLGEFWGCMSYPDCKYTEDIASAGRWMK